MLAAAILSRLANPGAWDTPKALLPYRGHTFPRTPARGHAHPRIGITRIVLGAGAEEIRAKLGLDPSGDRRQSRLAAGPALLDSGGHSQPAGDGTEGLILCPVDHPLVSADSWRELIGSSTQAEN